MLLLLVLPVVSSVISASSRFLQIVRAFVTSIILFIPIDCLFHLDEFPLRVAIFTRRIQSALVILSFILRIGIDEECYVTFKLHEGLSSFYQDRLSFMLVTHGIVHHITSLQLLANVSNPQSVYCPLFCSLTSMTKSKLNPPDTMYTTVNCGQMEQLYRSQKPRKIYQKLAY